MLAPPWIAIPPSGYGGIETVIAILVDALVAREHEVTLFAAPGSSSAGRTESMLDEEVPDEIGAAQHEADHVAAAFDAIEAARPRFDVVHDHCGHVGLAMADRLHMPLVHTEHGPFDDAARSFYERHGHRALIVGLSRSQLSAAPTTAHVFGAIPNPLDTTEWRPGPPKGDHVLWLGRFSETKGAHHAIAAARRADVPLILAGVVQPGQQDYFDRCIAPHVDGRRVCFAGEVGGERKRELLAGARALLMPITWDEPFGMVMVEAMGCGTPVISFPRGAATELVEDGRSGFLVDDLEGMAQAIEPAARLDPAACRERAIALCDPQQVARRYEEAYVTAIEAHPAAAQPASDAAGRTAPIAPAA